MMPLDVMLLAMRLDVESGQWRSAASIAEKTAPYLHAKMAARSEDGDPDREITIRVTRLKGNPEPVRVHDFAIPELGKAVPYGIYDVSANAGFVNVGISADTGEFSVASIRRWWYAVGAPRYPDARKILINADGGGSNGARLRLWKRELQVLADELRIEITVCHVPPGTSKWNKIEHRLFSFITQNWRGKPLISYLVIVQLIASTTTDSELTVACQLDENDYAKGTKVTDAEMAALNIQPAVFHGEWNYIIAPRRPDG